MRKILVSLLLVAAVTLAGNTISVTPDPAGVPSLSAGESNALIFEDDFESGDLSAWNVSQATDYSLSDSPGVDYLPNTDSWAAFNSGTAISLAGTSSPELTFWWYGKYFMSYDYMIVQGSSDGSSWDDLWDTISNYEETSWTEVTVDLSSYAGGDFYLRFFVHSSSVVEYDGGHFNNLAIFDDTQPVFAESCDTMDNITTGGANDTWGSEDEGMADQWFCADIYPYGGTYHAAGGYVMYDNNIDSYIEATGVDLSGSSTAALSCYANWDPADGGDILTVEVDTGGGYVSAGTIAATSDYQQRTVSLDSYTGGTVDVRFRLVTNGSGTAFVPLIDDVEINTDTGAVTEASWGEIKTLD